MDFSEPPEHVMLRDAVGGIAAKFGHEYFAERARTGGRATELWDAVGDAGFLGVHLPEEYGGGGGGLSELAIVSEELAAHGCPLLLVLVSAGISAEVIARFGTDAQKRRWLPGLATTDKMVFAITEPDAGSNTHNLAGKYSTLELPLEDVIRGHGDAASVSVQPFDVVTVSAERKPKMVFIAGEVNKPGAIELASQDTVSISKVLAMAGGFTHIASPGKTVIRHINSKGQETAFAFVNLKKIMSGRAKDLLLSDGDVVIVPSSQISTYLQTMSTTAITSSVYVLGRF